MPNHHTSDLSLIVEIVGMCNKANAEIVCCFPKLMH